MKTTPKKESNAELKALKKKLFSGYLKLLIKCKHSIEDYKNVIDCYYTEDLEKIKSTQEFEKIYSVQFHSMFEHISEEFQWRLKDLKKELMKRLDIKKQDSKKLQVITEENESDNEVESKSESESESESENESKQKQSFKSNRRHYYGPYNSFLKLKPGDTLNGIKYESQMDTKIRAKTEKRLKRIIK